MLLSNMPIDFEIFSKIIAPEATFEDILRLMVSDKYEGAIVYRPIGTNLLEKITASLDRSMIDLGASKIVMPTLVTENAISASKRVEFGFFKNFGIPLEISGLPHYLLPTHEEIAMNILEIPEVSSSYRDKIWFQFGIKYRLENEIKFPIRLNQFFMHDLYTFSSSKKNMQKLFNRIKKSYLELSELIGVKIYESQRLIDPIFNSVNVEFLSPCRTGFDRIVLKNDRNYVEKIVENSDFYGEKISALEVGHIYMLDKLYNPLIDSRFRFPDNVWYTATGFGVDRLFYVALDQAWDGEKLSFSDALKPVKTMIIPSRHSDLPKALYIHNEKKYQPGVFVDDIIYDLRGSTTLAYKLGFEEIIIIDGDKISLPPITNIQKIKHKTCITL